MDIIAADIGGTHARFAVAQVGHGKVIELGEPVMFKTHDYPDFSGAWQAFTKCIARPLPRAAAIAVAGPVEGATLTLTNHPWFIDRAVLCDQLAIDACTLLNDFAAVGHAVTQVGHAHFRHVCGPDVAVPDHGTISILGPGTGLGVAQIVRTDNNAHVIATEGGHIDFAPLDAFDDALLARLRAQHGRVSVERIVSGPGLTEIYESLAVAEHCTVPLVDSATLWALGLSGQDRLATAAIARFCQILGSVAGDIALAHGSVAVVIAGGIGLRMADIIAASGFATGFAAKGRFANRMRAIPVKLITHPHPGLFGAAAAFAKEHNQ